MILIHNQSTSPFRGYVRTTTDATPATRAGKWPNTPFRYVLGAKVGIAVTNIDVWCELAAGQRITLDLAAAVPDAFKLALPEAARLDPVGYYGVPSIMGQPLSIVMIDKGDHLEADVVEDGACYLAHFRVRGQPLCFDVWLRYCPEDGNEMPGELAITNSDERRADPIYTLPVDVLLQGEFIDEVVLLRAGETIADGQRRVWPVVYDRPNRRLESRPRNYVHARGIDRIGTLGSIADKGALDLPRWMRENGPAAEAALFSWDSLQVGVVKRSGDSGDVEDCGFGQGFESFDGGYLASVNVRYLAALTQSKRPCHHLDRHGNAIDPTTATPRLVYWDGRPHWHRNVSPNQLGKSRGIGPEHCHGWFGPDCEHFFTNNLAAALELTGLPALQDELRHHAMLYLGMETVDPAIATTHTFVSRSLGWTSLAVCHMWRLLNDRALAERVKARWLARVALYRAKWGAELWDVRLNDSEHPFEGLTSPKYWLGYQQAVGAFGAYVAAKLFGDEATRLWALNAARDVVDNCYVDEAPFVEWEIRACDASGAPILGPLVEGVNAHRAGFYRRAWLPLAVWVMHDVQPVEDYAAAIWAQIKAEPVDAVGNWARCDDFMPPLRVAP